MTDKEKREEQINAFANNLINAQLEIPGAQAVKNRVNSTIYGFTPPSLSSF